jgi:hypothetical protein
MESFLVSVLWFLHFYDLLLIPERHFSIFSVARCKTSRTTTTLESCSHEASDNERTTAKNIKAQIDKRANAVISPAWPPKSFKQLGTL